MASQRNNVGAIIGGTVAVAGVAGILGWWWWVYMAEAEAKGKYGPKPSGPPRSQLLGTPVVDEGTADQLAAEQPGPAIPDPGHQVPTVSLGGG